MKGLMEHYHIKLFERRFRALIKPYKPKCSKISNITNKLLLMKYANYARMYWPNFSKKVRNCQYRFYRMYRRTECIVSMSPCYKIIIELVPAALVLYEFYKLVLYSIKL